MNYVVLLKDKKAVEAMPRSYSEAVAEEARARGVYSIGSYDIVHLAANSEEEAVKLGQVKCDEYWARISQ